MTSYRAQVGRRRRLGGQALAAFPVTEPVLTFIAHGENTTVRVDAGTEAGPARFLLRVHRPGRHGVDVDPVAAVLLRWMDGYRRSGSPAPVQLYRLGAVVARLHQHAAGWSPPAGFVRIRWDHRTFFGDTMVYGNTPALQVWDLLPTRLRRQFDEVAERAGALMTSLGEGPDQFGLIHADLHLDNALFHRGELRHRPDYEAFQDAMLSGYASVRPLPDGTRDHLDAFIAAREVAFGLWVTGMAQANPAFEQTLRHEHDRISGSLDLLLRPSDGA
jgi:Ser/Thr protein kinase RdoA (MazF antagonist)